MKTTINTKREVMNLAWHFVKRNGYSLSEALKCAWLNVRIRYELHNRIVAFYFKKVDGTIRQAFGTLVASSIPAVQGVRKTNDSVQVYFDTEKQEYRCFKKCNLLSIA